MKKSSENSKIEKKSKTQKTKTKFPRNDTTGPGKSLCKLKSSDNGKTAKNSVKQQPVAGENLLKSVSDSDCSSSSTSSSSSSKQSLLSSLLVSNKRTHVNPSIKSNQIRQHKKSSINNLKVPSSDSSASSFSTTISSSRLSVSKKKTQPSSSTQSNQSRQHKKKNYNNLKKSTLSSPMSERLSVPQKKTHPRSSVKSKHLKRQKDRDNISMSNSSSLILSNSKKDTCTSLHVNSSNFTQQNEISSNNLDICAGNEIVQDAVRQFPPQNGLIHGTFVSSNVSKGHIRFDSDDNDLPLKQSFLNREKEENCVETPLPGDKSTVNCSTFSAANRLSPADVLLQPNHLIQSSKVQKENDERFVTSKRIQRNQSREANSEGSHLVDPSNFMPMEYSSSKEENIGQEHEVTKKVLFLNQYFEINLLL